MPAALESHPDDKVARFAAFREFVAAGQRFLWPKAHHWLQPRRVIPPHGYWSEADIAAETEVSFFYNLFYGPHRLPRAALHLYRSIVVLAQHEFPTWHVGSTLVHALLRTTVPANWPVERFKLPFPAIRLILEKGSFVLENGDEIVALQAFLSEPAHLVRLPPEVADELSTLDRDPVTKSNPALMRQADRARTTLSLLERMPVAAESHLAVIAWQTPADIAKFSFDVYSPSFSHTLGDVLSSQLVPSSEDGADPFRPRRAADQKRAIAENILPLLLNAVLLLTAKPEYIEGGGLARPVVHKGKRQLEALYHPRFLGKKFSYQRGSTTDRTLPGRKLAPGWRAGHWKDIAFGPNHSLRRHDWIEPYQYGLTESE